MNLEALGPLRGLLEGPVVGFRRDTAGAEGPGFQSWLGSFQARALLQVSHLLQMRWCFRLEAHM